MESTGSNSFVVTAMVTAVAGMEPAVLPPLILLQSPRPVPMKKCCGKRARCSSLPLPEPPATAPPAPLPLPPAVAMIKSDGQPLLLRRVRPRVSGPIELHQCAEVAKYPEHIPRHVPRSYFAQHRPNGDDFVDMNLAMSTFPSTPVYIDLTDE